MPSPRSEQQTHSAQNLLIAALPDDERARLDPLLEPLTLNFKDQLYEVGDPIDYVYFPTRGVASQVALLDGETAIEVTTIGREGMVGLSAFLGATTSPDRVFCQVPGRAHRLSTTDLRRHLAVGGPLHEILNRYTQATLVQLARSVACNRLHTVEERMSRWLLLTRDRADEDTFPLTHEFLAQMLGVRRATVTLSAGMLQNAGLIRYTRGQVTIADRQALERTSCDCYEAIRCEFARLLTDSDLTSPDLDLT